MSRISKAEKSNERGNALIYVLIAIVLFAALSFTMGRQTDTGEASVLDDGQVELLAGQLISYAAQAESAVNQMLYSGAREDELDFTLPNDTGFDSVTASDNIKKVFHPQGGGLTPGELDPKAVGGTASVVDAGWYLGAFNNTEWTKTAANDVMLSAFQVSDQVCAKLNEKIKGDPAIPQIAGPANLFNLFVDPAIHGIGSSAAFTEALCADCAGYSSLCVGKAGTNVFYTIVGPR
jgi:hypothetical protein